MDDNKLIKAGIVIGLVGLASFGAYVVANSFKSAPPVAMNNDPVDFSGPAQKPQKGKRLPASSAEADNERRPNASGSRSYGDSPAPTELPRMDAGSSNGGSFPSDSVFTPDAQQETAPLQAGGGGGGDSGSGERSPASAESGSGSGGSSMGGIFGGLGGLFGGGASTGGGGSNTGGGDTGGGTSPSPTPTVVPAGTSAGTTGGGAFVGETQNHYKASVSIGVPLSGVSGTTTGGGGYRYQVNLSGQQAQ